MNKTFLILKTYLLLLIISISSVSIVSASENPTSAHMTVTMDVSGGLVSSTPDGIVVYYPKNHMKAGEILNKNLIEVYLTYIDTYEDGSIHHRTGEEKITAFDIDKLTIEYGQNTFRIAEKATGRDFATNLLINGDNTILKSEPDGIIVSYSDFQCEAPGTIDKKKISIFYTYKDTYADGSYEEKRKSSDKPKAFDIDKLEILAGENTFTVTEKESGANFSASFTVTGIITEPKVISSKKSGIYIKAYPVKQMTSVPINKDDVLIYWIYEDTYNTGEIKERQSNVKCTSFKLSKTTLSKGNNEITVTEEETGEKYKASFITFGNYLYLKEIDGITCRYAYQNVYVGTGIYKEYATVNYTYKYVYADGSEYLNQKSSSKCTNFDLSKSTIAEGKNEITVTERVTGKGFKDSFTVIGEKKPNITPTPSITPTPTPKITATPTPTPTVSPITQKVTPTPTVTPSVGKTGGQTSSTASPAVTKAPVKESASPATTKVSDPVKEDVNEDDAELYKNRIFTVDSLIDGRKKTINYINGKLAEDESLRIIEDGRKILDELIDKEEMAKNEDAIAKVTLKVSDEILLSEEDRLSFAATLSEDEYIGKIYDISLEKRLNGNAPTIVTRLNDKITLTLDIPGIIANKDSEFFILRMHLNDNGVRIVDTLRDLDNKRDTITFETDRFSYFAICYLEEILPEVIEEEPCEHVWQYLPNGDNTHLLNCQLCGESMVEECTFSEGLCVFCGFKDPEYKEEVDFFTKYMWLFVTIGILLLLALIILLLVLLFRKKNVDEYEEESVPDVGEVTLNVKTNQIEGIREEKNKAPAPKTPLDEVMSDSKRSRGRNQGSYSGVPDIDYEGFTEYEGSDASRSKEWNYGEENE